MQCYAIKTQQIEKEIAEYNDYDWEIFGNLTIEEKMAEYLAIRKMLLMRKRSEHIYSKKCNESERYKERLRIGRKIFELMKLINLLDCIVEQMEIQIILLE